MLERLAGCWSLLFHEAHAVLWILSLKTNRSIQADKQRPQDIHKSESNNMSMFINHVLFFNQSTMKSKSSGNFLCSCNVLDSRTKNIHYVHHILSTVISMLTLRSCHLFQMDDQEFISWEKASGLTLSKSGAMAPSGSVHVKTAFISCYQFNDAFVPVKESVSSGKCVHSHYITRCFVIIRLF